MFVMDDLGQTLVPAADFVRHFGEWRGKANVGPVHVTHHGRISHTLLSRDQYISLSNSGAPSNRLDDLQASQIALLDCSGDHSIIVDREMIIRMANRAVLHVLRKRADEVIGKPFDDIFPMVRESFAYRSILRAIIEGEPSSADVPYGPENLAWFHVTIVPLAVGAGILSRNITAEVEAHRLADIKEAIVRLMDSHEGVGYARLSPRGFFQRANDSLCRLVGLSADALSRTRLANLIIQKERPAFNEAFDAIFADTRPRTLETRILGNNGSSLAVRVTLLQLRGEYASEGAIVLVTGSDGDLAVAPEDLSTAPAAAAMGELRRA